MLLRRLVKFLGLFKISLTHAINVGSRTFVHEDIYAEFVKKATAMAAARKVGNPFDEGVEQGPQVNKPTFHYCNIYTWNCTVCRLAKSNIIKFLSCSTLARKKERRSRAAVINGEPKGFSLNPLFLQM